MTVVACVVIETGDSGELGVAIIDELTGTDVDGTLGDEIGVTILTGAAGNALGCVGIDWRAGEESGAETGVTTVCDVVVVVVGRGRQRRFCSTGGSLVTTVALESALGALASLPRKKLRIRERIGWFSGAGAGALVT
jgi:hypothetical protein